MKLPARCRITEYDRFDRIGLLACADGQEVRFGASACTDFEPVLGTECWLIAATEDTVQGVLRASIVNLTGNAEPDRLAQLHIELRERDPEARRVAARRARDLEDAHANPHRQLERISQEFGVTLPPLYQRWALEGRFNRDSPDYLWLTMVRWLEPLDVSSDQLPEITALKDLVPFATSPYGDWWCWRSSRPTGPSEYQILFCQHDSEEAEMFAPDFPSLVARVAMRWSVIVDEESDGTEERKNLLVWSELLETGGYPTLAHHLTIASQPIGQLDPEGDSRALASEAEIAALVADCCGSSYLNASIRWQ